MAPLPEGLDLDDQVATSRYIEDSPGFRRSFYVYKDEWNRFTVLSHAPDEDNRKVFGAASCMSVGRLRSTTFSGLFP